MIGQSPEEIDIVDGCSFLFRVVFLPWGVLWTILGHGISFAHAAAEIVADALEGDATIMEYFEKARPPAGLPIPWINKTVLTMGELGYRLLDRLT